MFKLKGKFADATVFQDVENVESECIDQIKTLLNQPFIEGETVRVMADCHAGAGCTIGYTQTLKNGKICPNLVGVDIACGMLVVKLTKVMSSFILDNLPFFDDHIRTSVPSGLNVHSSSTNTIDLTKLYCYKALKNKDHIEASIGTLGGGNHFIELDKDNEDNLYLVIHSGSRNLGKQVAEIYQTIAVENLKTPSVEKYNKEKDELIKRFKKENRTSEIPFALNELKAKFDKETPKIPKDLAYLEGEDADNYLHDVAICTAFARENRKAIAKEILGMFTNVKLESLESFETLHNYIDLENKILRKGSVSAKEGEKLIIPMNMRDGSLLCIGKGNPEANYSAPHGAGRLMSRSKAKDSISLEDYKKSMEGIYTSCVNTSTLDESPMAYKSIESIIGNLGPCVSRIERIVPVYNFKASE